MPSKRGFGNTRKKGSAYRYGVDSKNPITFKSPLKNGDGPTDIIREGEFGTGRKIPKKNVFQMKESPAKSHTPNHPGPTSTTSVMHLGRKIPKKNTFA